MYVSVRKNLNFTQNSLDECSRMQAETEKQFESHGNRYAFPPRAVVDPNTTWLDDCSKLLGDCSKIERVAHATLSLASKQASLGRFLSSAVAVSSILPCVSVSKSPPIPQEVQDTRDIKELVGTAAAPGTFMQLADSFWSALEKHLEEESDKKSHFSNYREVSAYWSHTKDFLFQAVNRRNAVYSALIYYFERSLALLSEKDKEENSFYSFQFFEIFWKYNFMGVCESGAKEVVTGLDDYCRSLGLSVANNLRDIIYNALHSYRRDFIRSYFSFTDTIADAMEVHYYAMAACFYSKKLSIKNPDENPNYDIGKELKNLEIDSDPPSRVFWEKWYTLDNLIPVVANALQGKTGSEDDEKKIELSESDRRWWRDLYQNVVEHQGKAYFFQNDAEARLQERYIALANDSESNNEAWEQALHALQNDTNESSWRWPLDTVSSFQKTFNTHYDDINRIISVALLKKPKNEFLKKIKKTIFSATESDVKRFDSLSDLRRILHENTTLAGIVEELERTLSDDQRDKDRREVSKNLNAVDWDSWVCNNTFQTFREVTWNTNTNMPTRYGTLILLLETGLVNIADENLSPNSPYESFLLQWKSYKIAYISEINDKDELVSFIINNIQFLNLVSDSALLQDGVLSALIDSADNDVILRIILAIEGTLPPEVIIKIMVKFNLDFDEFSEKIPDSFELEEGVFEKLIADEKLIVDAGGYRWKFDIAKRILALKCTLSDEIYRGIIKKFGPVLDYETLKKIPDGPFLGEGVLEKLIADTDKWQRSIPWRILSLEGTQSDEIYYKLIIKFARSLDNKSWEKIAEIFLRREGVLDELIDRAKKRNTTIPEKILELVAPLSDEIFKKILEKFGPFLDIESLEKIPDRFFLEDGVLEKLIADADGYRPNNAIAKRIVSLEGTRSDEIFKKILEKFGTCLDIKSLEKIPDRFFLEDGALEELIADADGSNNAIAKRIVSLEGTRSDEIFKEILEKFGPFLIYIESLEKIPDRFFLEDGVLEKLIADAEAWSTIIPQRILSLEGTRSDEIFKKILEKFGPRLEIEISKKIPDRFFLEDGVLEELIDEANKKNTNIPKRIFELVAPPSDEIFKKILEKFGPFLDIETLEKIPDRFFLEDGVLEKLIADADRYKLNDALAKRIFELVAPLSDEIFKKILEKFGPCLDIETLEKIPDRFFLEDGVLEKLIADAEDWNKSVGRYYYPVSYDADEYNDAIAKRIVSLEGTRSDEIFKKILEKFGPRLDIETLEKIPDRFFLEDGVLEKLIADADGSNNAIAKRIVSLEGTRSDEIFKKILEKFRPRLDIETLEKIPDRFFLEDGVLEKLIADADGSNNAIAKRIVSLEGTRSDEIFKKILEKFGPFLDIETLEKIPDRFFLEDGVLEKLIADADGSNNAIAKKIVSLEGTMPFVVVNKFIEKFKYNIDCGSLCGLFLRLDRLEIETIKLLDLERIQRENPDALKHLGMLNPNVYSQLKDFSTKEMKALVKNKPELAEFFKYANKMQEISVYLHAGKIIKSFMVLGSLASNKLTKIIKSVLSLVFYYHVAILGLVLAQISAPVALLYLAFSYARRRKRQQNRQLPLNGE